MPGRIRLARSLSAPVEVQISARGNAGARARELANVWVPQIPGAIARCIRNAFHGRLHSRPRISFCGERDRHEARSIISLRKPQSAFQCSFVRLGGQGGKHLFARIRSASATLYRLPFLCSVPIILFNRINSWRSFVSCSFEKYARRFCRRCILCSS